MEWALLACAALLVAVIVTGEVFQQKTGVSAMPAPARVRRRMLALADPPPGGALAELGSGWGGMALAAARRYPGCMVTEIGRAHV